MFLVDSHCHLDLLNLNDEGNLNQVLARCHEQDVHYLLNVCVKLGDFPKVLAMAEKYPFVGASVGLHPNEQDEETDAITLIKLANHQKVIAIGETGLDYFRSTDDIEWQRKRFREHIRAAKQLQLPLIVHTRAAKEDTIQILREESASEVGGVMHCFTEDWPMAKEALSMNFDISFSGIVTFKNAQQIQEVAQLVPLDRMLIETDSPYLAPNPYRGKSNEPSYVRHTAEFLAQLRGIPLESFAEQTTQNFFRIFKKAVRPHV